MELKTQRLKIIPCTEEFLQINPAVLEYQVGPHIDTYLADIEKDSSLVGWGVWLVIKKENNMIIGDIGFKGKPDSDKVVEIGYGIAPSLQKKGYATEAVREIVKWAFTSNHVEKIVAECHYENPASIRVLEKIHFQRKERVKNMLKWELNRVSF